MRRNSAVEIIFLSLGENRNLLVKLLEYIVFIEWSSMDSKLDIMCSLRAVRIEFMDPCGGKKSLVSDSKSEANTNK